MRLEKNVENMPVLLAEPIGELTVARPQYNPVKSVFVNAYSCVHGALRGVSEKMSWIIDSYPERLKSNLKENKEKQIVPYSQKQKGFTLIEMLTTIGITGLLMAILLPSLQNARKVANSVACQSNLRQWGVAFATDEESPPNSYLNRFDPFIPARFKKDRTNNSFHSDAEKVFLCPEAKKLGSPVKFPPEFSKIYVGLSAWNGGKDSAWGYLYSTNQTKPFASGYSVNLNREYNPTDRKDSKLQDTPVLFDCTSNSSGLINAKDNPPEYDGKSPDFTFPFGMTSGGVAMNRHNGGINILSADYSTRKVGLKELWTLKWNKSFNTAGPWTKAGGVQPSDWPKWMKNFKDY